MMGLHTEVRGRARDEDSGVRDEQKADLSRVGKSPWQIPGHTYWCLLLFFFCGCQELAYQISYLLSQGNELQFRVWTFNFSLVRVNKEIRHLKNIFTLILQFLHTFVIKVPQAKKSKIIILTVVFFAIKGLKENVSACQRNRLLYPGPHSSRGEKGDIVGGKSEGKGKTWGCLPRRQALGHRKPG